MLVVLSLVLTVLSLALSLLLARRLWTSQLHLAGRTVFITGCDSGFGFSLASHCAGLGMKVVAGCFSDGEGRRHLEGLEGVDVVSLDVRKPESVAEAVMVVRRVAGEDGLHCLVNNAASLVFGEAAWQTEEQVRWQLEVNYLGPLTVTRASLPLLARGRGRVVNMISNCTECPLPTLGPYTASKAALLALSEVMRAEVRKLDVKIVIVNPGDAPHDTPLTSGQARHYQDMERRLSAEEKILHGECFSQCQQYYSKLFPLPALKKIDNPSYYRTMETVLASQSPRPYYANSAWVTTLVFGLISWLPRHLADRAKLTITKCYDQK